MRFLKYPAVFFAAGGLCFLALWALRRISERWGLVDCPRERHIHAKPIPLIGGMAIFAAFFGAGALAFWGPWGKLPGRLDAEWFRSFFAIAGLYLALGVVDDRVELKPRWKLAGQVLAAGVAYMLNIRFGRVLGMDVPVGLDLAATVVWFVAFVNAFNLIDGMDGVATGVAMTGGAGLLILFGLQRQPSSVLVVLAMLGACSVFLRYNFYPAKYFLGDAGSMLLGAFFSTVALSSNTKSMTVASLGFPLLVVGVPLMDSMLAVWRRVMRKVLGKMGSEDGAKGNTQVMGGDLEHLHHRLAQRGHSPQKVAYILYGLNAFLVLVGLGIMVKNSWAVGLAFVSFVILVYVVVGHLATIELGLSRDALLEGMNWPKAAALAAVVYPIFDCAALLLGALLTILLTNSIFHSGISWRMLWLQGSPLLVSLPMGLMFLTGTYRRLWSRARISEYAFLAFALAGGCVAGAGILALFWSWSWQPALVTACLLVFFDAGMIVGARIFPRIAMDLRGWGQRHRFHEGMRRVLVYGAGYKTTLLLREMIFRRPCEQTEFFLMGLVDDNPAMWRRTIHGYPVQGGIDFLCLQIEEGHVDEVMIACNLDPAIFQRLVEQAQKSRVCVNRWVCVQQPVVPMASSASVEP